MNYNPAESVLPLKIGTEDELQEMIFCDSIAGGQRYYKKMPKDLTLVRRFSDGREIRAQYVINPMSVQVTSPE